MIQCLIRFVVLRLIRLFYPRIEVAGRERLPTHGPIVFVLNHPNGLLDPLLLMATLDQPIAFLAKSTFFANPLWRVCMDAFGALPVYRKMDQGQQGRAETDAADRNEATFAHCRALLRQHRPLALFPEGTTHGGSRLLPLRTGAARIALSAEAEHNWQLGVQIVPVGLWYQRKTQFRSSVLLVVGEPYGIGAYARQYAEQPQVAVRDLTRQIRSSLDRVVLQAEHAEVLNGMPAIAAWTALHGPPLSLQQHYARTVLLLRAYGQLSVCDPARATALAQQARRYARTLHVLGISDPWGLELPAIKPERMIKTGVLLMASVPLAIAGFTLSYGPYRLAGVLTPRLVGHHDTLIGTGKLIVGSVLVLLGWIITAIIAGLLTSAWWGVLLLTLAPLLAYVALRWGEAWHELRETIVYRWLWAGRSRLTQQLIERRRALAQQVLAALQTTVTEQAQPTEVVQTR